MMKKLKRIVKREEIVREIIIDEQGNEYLIKLETNSRSIEDCEVFIENERVHYFSGNYEKRLEACREADKILRKAEKELKSISQK